MTNAINNIAVGDRITFTASDLSQTVLTRKVISTSMSFTDEIRYNVSGYNGGKSCRGMMVTESQIMKVNKAK